MATIQLTAAQLKSKKEELERLNKAYVQQLAQLGITEVSLMSMWEGDAAKAFNDNFKKDSEGLLQYAVLINKYASALGEIIAAYTKAENKNIQTARTRSAK